jgi:hypothetical protein
LSQAKKDSKVKESTTVAEPQQSKRALDGKVLRRCMTPKNCVESSEEEDVPLLVTRQKSKEKKSKPTTRTLPLYTDEDEDGNADNPMSKAVVELKASAKASTKAAGKAMPVPNLGAKTRIRKRQPAAEEETLHEPLPRALDSEIDKLPVHATRKQTMPPKRGGEDPTADNWYTRKKSVLEVKSRAKRQREPAESDVEEGGTPPKRRKSVDGAQKSKSVARKLGPVADDSCPSLNVRHKEGGPGRTLTQEECGNLAKATTKGKGVRRELACWYVSFRLLVVGFDVLFGSLGGGSRTLKVALPFSRSIVSIDRPQAKTMAGPSKGRANAQHLDYDSEQDPLDLFS